MCWVESGFQKLFLLTGPVLKLGQRDHYFGLVWLVLTPRQVLSVCAQPLSVKSLLYRNSLEMLSNTLVHEL